MPALDIILPVYKPLEGWEAVMLERNASLQRALPEWTIRLIIVNDGTSGLETSAAWQRLRTMLPDAQLAGYATNRGKGHALRHGVSMATADYILYTDVDWPYTESSMLALISQLASGADAVIGVRDADYYAQLPAIRRLISRGLRRFNGALLRLKVNDTQAGLKGFRRPLASVFMSTTIDRYLFDLEFIYRLSRMDGVVMAACPIALRPGITFSSMNRKILLQEAGNFLKIWLRIGV